MAKIIQLIVASDLLDQIRASAKQNKISVGQWIRAAIHHHLIELNNLNKWNKVNKQKPEIINLLDVPVARWSMSSALRQHFEEDR